MGITSAHCSEFELACHGTTCGIGGTGCHDNFCTQELVDGLEAFRAKAFDIWTAKNVPADHPAGQRARAMVTFPGITVHDAYRCVAHNAGTTGAVSDSQHPNGRAADLSVHGLTAGELEQCALAVPAFAKGGIGRDDIRDMIHVDHRPSFARWCYYQQTDGSVKWGPYYRREDLANGATALA